MDEGKRDQSAQGPSRRQPGSHRAPILPFRPGPDDTSTIDIDVIRREHPLIDPPLARAVALALSVERAERAAREPEDPIVGKRLRKAKDPYRRLGTRPNAYVGQETIKGLLREMAPGEEKEIVLGERARKYISTMPSGADIPDRVLTIYGAKDGSWYVDLVPDPDPNKPRRSRKSGEPIPNKLDVSDVVLTEEQERRIPRKIKLFKTHDVVNPGLIEYIKGELIKKREREGSDEPVTPLEVIGTVGDVMHILARTAWGRYLGEDSDYATEEELESGRIIDVYDPDTGEVGEYCTPNQALRKMIRTAVCATELGPGHTVSVYLYDPNTEYWSNNASAWN